MDLQRARAIVRRHEGWLWAVFVVGLLAYRWPLLKGYYYKFAHVEAPASRIAWRTDFNAALAEADATHRPVLVDFTASWCPPCIAMKHDVWPDSEVERAVAAGYVPVSIDIDRDTVVSARYRVETIPTLLIVDSDGRVIRTAGYLPRSGMLRFLAGN